MGDGFNIHRDKDRQDFLRQTAGVLALRITAAGCGFLSGVLLARFLGPSEFGTLVFAGTLGGVLGALSLLGFHQLLVREIAIYHGCGASGRIKGIIQFCSRTAFLVAVLLAACAWMTALVFAERPDMPNLMPTLSIILLGVPIATLVHLRQSVMRGLNRTVLGILPDQGILPLLSLLLLLVTYFAFGRQLTAPQAATIGLISVIVAFGIGQYLLGATLPDAVRTALPSSTPRAWLIKASPLFLIATVQFTNAQADMLMLGLLAPAEDLGFYAVSRSLAEIVIFVLVAIEIFVAPDIAQLYTSRALGRLQILITRATRMAMAAAVPVVLVLLLAGDWILPIYGPMFIKAMPALNILCAGQLINTACGPIGQLAIHTGHDRATIFFVLFAAFVNILLNAALIPHFGAIGAAIATATSMVVWNIGLTVFIFLRTGLLSFVVGSGRHSIPALAASGSR